MATGTLRASTGGYNNDVGLPTGGKVTLTVPAGTVTTGGVPDVLVVLLQQTATSLEVTAAPVGFTKLAAQVGPTGGVVVAWAKRAAPGDAGAALLFTGTNTTDLAGVMLVIANITSTATNNTGMVGNVGATGTGTSLTVPATGFGQNIGYSVFAAAQGSASAGKALDSTVSGITAGPNDLVGIDLDRLSPTLARTFSTSTSTSKALIALVFGTDVLPNAPGELVPDGTTFDRAVAQRWSWLFSSPRGTDGQTKHELRFRVGSGAWTTLASTSPNQFRDFAAGYFPAATYEWQVRTAGTYGTFGAWSASAFVTAADLPAAATITSPTSGGTVAAQAALAWSYPSHTAYQVRRLGDLAGVADTSVVYYDSGIVVDPGTRSVLLSFATRDRFEHLQVRVMDADTGLWVPWSSVRVLVSYTLPPIPAVVKTPVNTVGTDFGTDAIQLDIGTAPYNLVSTNQASLEADATGYAGPTNCSLTRSTAQALDGAASLAVTATAAGTVVFRTNGTTSIAVLPSTTYMIFGSWRAATTPRQMKVRAQSYRADPAGLVGTAVDSVTITDRTTGWTRAVVEITTHSTATHVIVYPQSVDALAAGEVHYWDGLMVKVGPANRLLSAAAFDLNSNGWAGGTGAPTLSRPTTTLINGRVGLRAVSNTAGSMRVTTPSSTDWYVPVTPGTQITLGFDVLAETTARSITGQIQFYDAAGATVGGLVNTPTIAVPQGVVTRVAGPVTVPAGVTFARQYLLAAATTVGDSFLFDKVMLSSGAVDLPWNDNAYTGPPSALSHFEVHRRELGDPGDGIRIGKDLPAGTWLDRTPAHLVEYEHQVTAIGTNDTRATSGWTT